MRVQFTIVTWYSHSNVVRKKRYSSLASEREWTKAQIWGRQQFRAVVRCGAERQYKHAQTTATPDRRTKLNTRISSRPVGQANKSPKRTLSNWQDSRQCLHVSVSLRAVHRQSQRNCSNEPVCDTHVLRGQSPHSLRKRPVAMDFFYFCPTGCECVIAWVHFTWTRRGRAAGNQFDCLLSVS